MTSLKGSTESKFFRKVYRTQRREISHLFEITEIRGIAEQKDYRRNTSIIPSEVVESIVISQIPLMVGRISAKSEDLFERQRVIVA